MDRLFGNWIYDKGEQASLAKAFQTARPYPHIIIHEFLNAECAEACAAQFPSKHDPHWNVYFNPMEIKLANSKADTIPEALRELILHYLQHPHVLRVFESITGIPGLEADPFMHGAGIHCHPYGGKLDVHLDYGIHPLSGKERRLNLILYLSKGWKEEYGGGLQLWDDKMQRCERTCPCAFNTAVLLRTSDLSYHGMPDPLRCPPDNPRNSVAVYYLSNPRQDIQHRYKASYVKRPDDPSDEHMDFLRKVRVERRLTPEDLQGWCPSWEYDPAYTEERSIR